MIHPSGRYISSYGNSDLERVTKSEGAMTGNKFNRWVRNLHVRKWEVGTFSECKNSFVVRPPVCSPLDSLGKGEVRLEEEWPDYKGSQKSVENLGLSSQIMGSHTWV